MRRELPERLRRYEFKQFLPEHRALPPPSEEYLEMETAKAFHYTWREWLIESPVTRAKLVAHELARGMRETYNFEQRASDKDKAGAGKAPWQAIRDKFFGKAK